MNAIPAVQLYSAVCCAYLHPRLRSSADWPIAPHISCRSTSRIFRLLILVDVGYLPRMGASYVQADASRHD